MSGIDNILNQIKQDSDNIVNEIITNAENKVNEIFAQANKDSKEIAETLHKEAEMECDNIIERANSTGDLIRKKAILRAKQEIISSTISNAHTKLLSLNDDEYFNLIIKMIEKYSSNEKGKIMFNKRDLERLPLLFSAKVSKVCNGNLKIDSNPVNIDGGFILSYGNIEENCSFQAIFYENTEILQDKVNKLLFS